MPLDALSNPLVLPLLGLLVEQPSHAYELTLRLAQRYAHVPVRRSSVTTLARRLSASGLIRPQRRRRVDRRPARVAYELTQAGYDLVRERVAADVMAAPAGSTRFVTAVAYLGMLPRQAAARVLRARLEARRSENAVLAAAPSLPEFQMLEVSYWRAVVHAEVTWLDGLARRLESGSIDWPHHRRHQQ
jgi:DNA-binding PadR family transcriptional regulator